MSANDDESAWSLVTIRPTHLFELVVQWATRSSLKPALRNAPRGVSNWFATLRFNPLSPSYIFCGGGIRSACSLVN